MARVDFDELAAWLPPPSGLPLRVLEAAAAARPDGQAPVVDRLDLLVLG